MMVVKYLQYFRAKSQPRYDAYPDVRMTAHDLPFLVRQAVGLAQNTVINADFAHVVEQRACSQNLQCFARHSHGLTDLHGVVMYTARVTLGVLVLCFHGGDDGINQQHLLLLSIQVQFPGIACQQQGQKHQEHQPYAMVHAIDQRNHQANGHGGQHIGHQAHHLVEGIGRGSHTHQTKERHAQQCIGQIRAYRKDNGFQQNVGKHQPCLGNTEYMA